MEYLISKEYSPETPYYFYKTTNLINGRFYYGSGSKKNYLGSSTELKIDIKKYGKKNFKQEKLRYFKTREDAYRFEFKFLTLIDAKNISECYNLQNEVTPAREGLVTVKDTDGNTFQVTKEEYDRRPDLVGATKGYEGNKEFTAKDKDGNTFKIQKDDPRYLSGELVGVRKGTTQIQHNSIEVNVLGQSFSSKAEAMRELKVNSRTLNKLISGELKELPRNHYKRLIVDGVEYESKVDAMKKLKIGSRKLNRIMTLVK